MGDKEIAQRPDKSFNITTDLKNAFGSSSNSSTGFSFGFLGGDSSEVGFCELTVVTRVVDLIFRNGKVDCKPH